MSSEFDSVTGWRGEVGKLGEEVFVQEIFLDEEVRKWRWSFCTSVELSVFVASSQVVIAELANQTED